MKKLKSKLENQDPTYLAHVANIEYKTKDKNTILKTIEIHPPFQDMLILQVIIRFLQSKSELQDPTLLKYPSVAQDFIDYIAEHYTSSKEVPTIILQLYANHLTNSKGLKRGSTRTLMSILYAMLVWGDEQDWISEISLAKKTYYLAVLSNRPSIPKNSELDGTRLAMSELVQSKNYDDSILISSLQKFCIGFLSICQRHRAIILNYPEVKHRTNIIDKSDANGLDWNLRKPNTHDYDAIFNAIVASEDQSLIERILISNPKYREDLITASKPITLNELYFKLKACVRPSVSISPNSLTDPEQYVTFAQLDFRSLLAASEAEEICLRWLLATDRIQLAGQDNLIVDDIEITPSHATIHFMKKRSESEERTATLHRRKTWQYKILSYYKKLKSDFEKNHSGTSLNPDNFFQYKNPFAQRQHFNSITYRPIILATWPNTESYRNISNSNSGAEYFQEYYQSLILQNTNSNKGFRATSSLREALKIYEKHDSDGELGSKSLTVNVIAQSRAIVDPDEPRTKSPFDRFAQADVGADATAHSINTKEFIYKNRSKTIHRVSKRSKFVEAVGDLQEVDARKLDYLLAETKSINLQEINDTLGVEINLFKNNDILEFNALIEAAEAKGYTCSPFGYLNTPQRQLRIVVMLPVTAALILSYIDTCKDELQTADSLERRRALLLEHAYATIVLRRFDQRTIEEGKALKAKYAMPTPFI